MKKLLTFLLGLTSLSAFAQIPEYEDYICPAQTYSEYTPDHRQGKSHWICDSDNDYWVSSFTGDTHIVESISVERVPDGDDHYKAKLKIEWKEGRQGTIFAEVKYRRYWVKCRLCTSCEIDDERVIYKYRIDKRSTNPGGNLTGSGTVVANDITGTVNVNLLYMPTSGTGSIPVRIRYNNGETDVETTVDYPSATVNGVPVTFKVNSFGTYTLAVDVQNDCGDWFPGLSKVINVYPSCYQNSSGQLRIDELPYDRNGMRVQKDVPYTMTVTGITSFSSHYYFDVEDGGDDVILDGFNFTLLKGLGSYRINAVKKPGRELCPNINPLKIFAGGEDIVLDKTCGIIIPDDLAGLGYTKADDPNVREHFAATVTSKRSITIKPGLTLTLGAELDIDLPGPLPPPNGSDTVFNYIQAAKYDEYNRLLTETRSYFDEQGRGLQVQSKDLNAGIILTNQTIYDAYGREAIKTLPAPTQVIKTTPDECIEGKDIVTEDVSFVYKPDFVKAANNQVYNFSNFDNTDQVTKEESPDALSTTDPGTLGWYYSTNNGSLSSSNPLAKMQEPLVASTAYPYMRTLYHRDGSGSIKGTTKAGDAFRAGNGNMAFQNQEPVLATDPYLTKYFSMRFSALGLQTPVILEGQFQKNVSIDEDERRTEQYVDKDGRQIITLYYGSLATPFSISYKFFDDLGMLLASVTPNGVDQYENHSVPYSQIDKVTYKYDFRGMITEKTESDGGTNRFIYRDDGKIRFSQNSEQEKTGKFSYSHYDRLGRLIESGEYISGPLQFGTQGMTELLEKVGSNGFNGTLTSQTFTYYDESAESLKLYGDARIQPLANALSQSGRKQRFLMGGVSCSMNDNIITWYSYDEQGRVEWSVEDIKDLGMKTLDYHYGPTGEVEEITFQKGNAEERFSHFFEYSPNGRLHKLYTTIASLTYDKSGKLSNDGITYDADGKIKNTGPLSLQASYFYYLHGPLKRIVYGNNLQGIDYTYTPDGKLKGINSGDKTGADPGNDGTDVFGLTIDYFNGDYSSPGYSPSSVNYTSNQSDQFTGVIKGIRWHSPIEGNKTFAYGYQYDDRYQLIQAQWGNSKAGSLTFATDSYKEQIGTTPLDAYDKNGNITSLYRTNEIGNNIARYKYHYAENSNKVLTIANPQNPSDVIKKFSYNSIGQMTEQAEVKQSLKQKMEYNVQGKVTAVRDANDKLVASYFYDDRGFRMRKISYDETGKEKTATWYVRDSNGLIRSVFVDNLTDKDAPVQTDLPVYGLERVGVYKSEFDLMFYELSDHLGNVRAVIGGSIDAEYLATMESERIDLEQCATCPFIDLKTDEAPTYINHTGGTVSVDGNTFGIDNPNQVIRINNAVGTEKKPIGGGIILPVSPGDVVDAEVFAKYQNFNKDDKTSIIGIAGYLAATFGAPRSIIDGVNIFNGLDAAPAGVFDAWKDVDEDSPKAFLTYIVYDKNFVPVKFNYSQVSTAAKIPNSDLGEGDPFMHQHERLALEDIKIEKEGFIYIYVANLSDQNMEVFFDDLRVNHTYSNIVAGGDFYPFGMEIKDRQITRQDYRFGYQGKFSELDRETGWNHFESREYDPEIGRWLSPDPARQYHNPYLAYGNNPALLTDPDGAWASQKGFYVHQISIQYGLWHVMNLSHVHGYEFTKAYRQFRLYLGILEKATEYADSKQFQGAVSSFRHAMRNGTQSPLTAKDLANAFVREQYNKAFALRAAGKEEESVFEFGVGLHVLQDATSPAHGGFQEWTGEEHWWEEAWHVMQELFYPGWNSNLQKVTNKALKWYLDGKLPEGDLFKDIKVDK